jgi:hypothetical protein
MAMEDILGKIVTLTGNNEVGYGSEGDAVFGRVVSVRKAGYTSVYPLSYDGDNQDAQTIKLASATVASLSGSGDYVVAVQHSCFAENVEISSTAAKQPAVGNAVAVDGAGGIVKLGTWTVASTAATVVVLGAVATSVDTTNGLATIRIM